MFSFKSLRAGFCLALLTVAGWASAGTIKTADSFGLDTLGGGEFKVTTFTGMTPAPTGPNVKDTRGGGSLFQTFCIEYQEHLSHGTTYYWTLNTKAIQGGVGPAGDPLDFKTAYVFENFWKGTLGSGVNAYAYSPNGSANAQREQDAYDLQRLIWYYEGEANGAIAGKAVQWNLDAIAAGWTSLHNVRVLNLWTNSNYTGLAQDLLIVVPNPTASTAGLGLLAAVGLFGWKRRSASRLA